LKFASFDKPAGGYRYCVAKGRKKDTQVDLEENLRVSDPYRIRRFQGRPPRRSSGSSSTLLTYLLRLLVVCGFWSHQSSASVSVFAGFRVVEKGGVTFSSCTGREQSCLISFFIFKFL
jgi:hypothetical protein